MVISGYLDVTDEEAFYLRKEGAEIIDLPQGKQEILFPRKTIVHYSKQLSCGRLEMCFHIGELRINIVKGDNICDVYVVLIRDSNCNNVNIYIW